MEQTCALDLLSRTEEGEFWMEEAEFLEEFDEVTVGYPISSQGFILSIYTGTDRVHCYCTSFGFDSDAGAIECNLTSVQ